MVFTRLANPRSAGDDEHLGSKCHLDSSLLTVSERQTGALLNPWDGLPRINRRPGKLALVQDQEPVGDGTFGAMESSKKNSVAIADTVGNHRAIG
jgi:hypothetical protein